MPISLSTELQQFGEQLLRELDKTQDKPASMFWTNTIAQREWVLFIALPAALESVQHKNGNTRDEAGSRILKIIKKLRNGRDDFRFVIASPRHSLVQSLGMMINTEPNSIALIEMNNNIVNGVNTGENLVYRLNSRY